MAQHGNRDRRPQQRGGEKLRIATETGDKGKEDKKRINRGIETKDQGRDRMRTETGGQGREQRRR